MIRAYRASLSDMGAVTELDWRTQEFAMGVDGLKDYLMTPSKRVYAAKASTKHIGFAAVLFNQFDTIDKSNQETPPKPVVNLRAIGTHPLFRRNHVARKIIERIDIEARNLDTPFGLMRIAVPDYQIDDLSDPWNVEQFLWKMGFKALKSVAGPHPYGDRDWYIMERKIA